MFNEYKHNMQCFINLKNKINCSSAEMSIVRAHAIHCWKISACREEYTSKNVIHFTDMLDKGSGRGMELVNLLT